MLLKVSPLHRAVVESLTKLGREGLDDKAVRVGVDQRPTKSK